MSQRHGRSQCLYRSGTTHEKRRKIFPWFRFLLIAGGRGTNEASAKTFRILLNASYLGKFYLPTVYVEAMYDKSVSARIPGRWVQVVAPSDS